MSSTYAEAADYSAMHVVTLAPSAIAVAFSTDLLTVFVFHCRQQEYPHVLLNGSVLAIGSNGQHDPRLLSRSSGNGILIVVTMY